MGNLEGKQALPEGEVAAPLRDFTHEQLKTFKGKRDTEIYVAIRGIVYDVSPARDMYGEGQGYHCFAGREATRAFAKMSFEEEDLANWSEVGLPKDEIIAIDGWVEKYEFKYWSVGCVTQPPNAPPLREYTLEELSMYKGYMKKEEPAEKVVVEAEEAEEGAEAAAAQASEADLPTPPPKEPVPEEPTAAELATPSEGPFMPIPHGKLHPPVLMSILGQVVDASYGGYHLFGPGGEFQFLAGRDVSRIYATQTFPTSKDEQIGVATGDKSAVFDDLSDLTQEQFKKITSWEKRFIKMRKYPVVGTTTLSPPLSAIVPLADLEAPVPPGEVSATEVSTAVPSDSTSPAAV